MVIDEQGDRKPDYTMAILNNGSWVTLFDYTAATQTLTPVTLDGFTWAAGKTKAPPGGPPCGWDDELCPDGSSEYQPERRDSNIVPQRQVKTNPSSLFGCTWLTQNKHP